MKQSNITLWEAGCRQEDGTLNCAAACMNTNGIEAELVGTKSTFTI
jgi:hypothetical protein